MEKKTSFKKGIRSMATEGARSRQTVQAERLNTLESDVESIREEMASAVQAIKQQRDFLLNAQENQIKLDERLKINEDRVDAKFSRIEEMFTRLVPKQEGPDVDKWIWTSTVGIKEADPVQRVVQVALQVIDHLVVEEQARHLQQEGLLHQVLKHPVERVHVQALRPLGVKMSYRITSFQSPNCLRMMISSSN